MNEKWKSGGRMIIKSFLVFCVAAGIGFLLCSESFASETSSKKDRKMSDKNKSLQVRVSADRADALYKNNEVSTFTIEVLKNGKPATEGEVDVWLGKDGGPVEVDKKKFDLSKQNPFNVTGTVSEPAFFLCQAWVAVGDEKAYGEKMVWYRAPQDAGQLKIVLKPDHSDYLYHSGEKAEFTASVTQNGKAVTDGKLELRLSREGIADTISKEVFDLSADKPLKISGTLSDAAFLYCQANLARETDNGKPVSTFCSVGYDVDKIMPETANPDDFKKFWDETLALARQLKMDVKLDKIENLSSEKATFYKFSINTLNNERVYGFMGIPAGRGPFPAIALYPGAGPGYGSPVDCGWTSRGVITLMMNVHKYPVAERADEAKKQLDNYIASHNEKAYFSVGASSRETFHFYTILTGFCRALDYICSREDWDGRHLMISGSSQGGFLTLAMSGLYADKVTSAMAGVPLGDLGRACRTQFKYTGEAMKYYDAVNFAGLIKCPIRMSVGFIDSSCPPGTVFGAYNSTPVKDKKIRMETTDGHGTTPERQAFERDWINKSFGF